MGIKELEFATENIRQLIELRLEHLREGTVQAHHVLDVCQLYRRQACGVLLANNDVEGFQRLLYQSADAWLQFLTRKHLWPDLDGYSLSRGHAEPLLDAVAVGSAALTRSLDERVESHWQEGLEHPEDYWFFQLLPKLTSSSTPQDELLHGLDRMEETLEGAEYPRFDALKALTLRDSNAFEAALLATITAHRARMDKSRRSGMGNALGLLTDAHVFIEGLALVRVARARGLRTRSQYPLIPPIVLAWQGLPTQPCQPLWED